MNGEAPAVVGSGSSVSRHREWQPKTEDVCSRSRLSGLFRKAGPLSEAVGGACLRLLPNAQSCSPFSRDGFAVDPEVLAGTDRTWKVSRTRGLVAYVLVRLDYKLKDVAGYLD